MSLGLGNLCIDNNESINNDIDNNNDNDNNEIKNDSLMVRLLEAGLFEYLQTNSILELLQSSRLLNSFEGIFNS